MFFTVAMRIAAAPVSGERMKNLIHTGVWRELILGFLAYLARFKKTLMSHLRSEEDGKKISTLLLVWVWAPASPLLQGKFWVRISAMYLYSVEKQLLQNYMYTKERGNLSVQQGRGIWEAGVETT